MCEIVYHTTLRFCTRACLQRWESFESGFARTVHFWTGSSPGNCRNAMQSVGSCGAPHRQHGGTATSLSKPAQRPRFCPGDCSPGLASTRAGPIGHGFGSASAFRRQMYSTPQSQRVSEENHVPRPFRRAVVLSIEAVSHRYFNND